MAPDAIVNWWDYTRDNFAGYFLLAMSSILTNQHLLREKVTSEGDETPSGFSAEFFVAIPTRDAATLLPILQPFFLQGTTVVSDLWAAYNTIDSLGYQHLTVNHSLHFVDPETHATISHLESMWSRAKKRKKRKCGTSRAHLDSYLIEFLGRQHFNKDPFQNLLPHIRAVCPMSTPS